MYSNIAVCILTAKGGLCIWQRSLERSVQYYLDLRRKVILAIRKTLTYVLVYADLAIICTMILRFVQDTKKNRNA